MTITTAVAPANQPVPQPPVTDAAVGAASTKRAELLPLTGLRAVAALAVVLSHIRLPKSAPTWLVQTVDTGFIGVPLFFMLSGFVLAYNYPDLNARSGRNLLRFYVARFARVMPLYYVVLLYTVVLRAAAGKEQYDLWWHVFAIQTWSSDLATGQQTYNGPAWSICVEVVLYLIFPFVIPVIAAIAKRFGSAGLLTVAGFCFAIQVALVWLFTSTGWADLKSIDPMSGHRWLYRNPLPHITEFIIGICLAFLLARGFRFKPRTSGLLQAIIIIVVPVLCAVRPWYGEYSGVWRVSFFSMAWTIPFGLLIYTLASNQGFFARFLSTRVMLTLGTASYALYLTHRPLLEGLGRNLVPGAPGIWGYILVIGLTCLTLLIAEGAHRYIELPGRKFFLRFAPAKATSTKASTTDTPAKSASVEAPAEPASGGAAVESGSAEPDPVDSGVPGK